MSPSHATSIRRAPTLLVALVLLFTALALPPVPASADPAETFADDFQTSDFTGSTGTASWAGPWIEVGESDGVAAGVIQVGIEPNCFSGSCMILGKAVGANASVTREANLGAFASATLTFNYQTHAHLPGSGSATLEISVDGGGGWIPLDAWPLDVDTGDQIATYDISQHLSAATQIRFSVTGSTDDSHLNVDELLIEANPAACFLVGNNSSINQLTTFDLSDPDPLASESTLGNTGADVKAIALDPNTGNLYAATTDQLHTVNKTSGAVSTIGPFGSSGPTVFNQVAALAFDPTSGFLYATHYLSGQGDLIMRVDTSTGSVIPDAFGPGIDYVEFDSDKAAQENLVGLAVDTTGQMWGMGWDGNSQYKLHTIDKATGAAIDTDGSDDVAGLSFDGAGTLWGIDPAGLMFEVTSPSNSRDLDNLTTYAGLTCETAVAPPSPDPGEIVISEVSHRNDDFIELYNAGSASVDINDYRVRLDGTGTSHLTVTQGGSPIILPPGGHYLLATAGSGLDGVADQTFSFGLPSDLGIRLRDPSDAPLDEYGHGSSPWSEGSPLPSMPAGTDQSYERLNGSTLGNCQDTDDNRSDFVHNWGHSNPQSTLHPAVPCGVPTPASHVVISEFRPEGPGGTEDEFAELFNPTALAADISGWVFHITQPGLFRDYHTIPGGTILDPGEHYLLSNNAGPTPADAQPYDIATNYSASWGDVVLKDNVGTIIDVLGYGDSGFGQLYEGVPLPAYGGGTDDRSFMRRGGGYTDTDGNMADFVYAFTATPQRSTPDPGSLSFYLVASNGGGAGGDDLLTQFDHTDFDDATNETDIGSGLGTTAAEGAAIDPSSGLLYVAVGDRIGIADTVAGTYSPRPSIFGIGGGAQGSVTFSSVVALAFQPSTDHLYAVVERDSQEDLLVRVDPDIGVHVPGAFGGDDYVPIEGLPSSSTWNESLAFDPTTGLLYGVSANLLSSTLVTIDPATGATTAVGSTAHPTYGLSFDESGQLWGIKSLFGTEEVHEIDKATGNASNPRPVDNGSDYRAIAISGTPPPNLPPVFDQDLGDRTDPEGALISINSSATDPNPGDNLTYSATGLPDGVSIDPATGTISGSPSATSSGIHAVTITVGDDATPSLQDIDTFTWTVSPGSVTYLVANTGGGNGGDDLLTVVDRSDANPVTNEVSIGTGTGTDNIEAAALQPGTNVLFAVENDQLGTIDITTGVFTARPSTAGTGSGTEGLITFANIESLIFDPYTAELFATHRRGTGEEDLLFRFDPSTGAHVSGAFGGDDYVVIQKQHTYHHAADMTFDPTDGQLYVVHWDAVGLNWTIATLDPVTGATATMGIAPDDIVSLAFDEAGRLYASTETGGAETLYELDKADGAVVGSIVIDNGSNYEAMAIAFPVDANRSPAFNQDLLDRTDAEGATISLSAAATDPDLHGLVYAATGLPSGLSIDPSSGLIAGTIDFAASAASPYNTVITVTDDGIPNLAANDTFTWTVTESNRVPVFDQDLPDRSDAEGAVISLSAAATDPDPGDVVTYGVAGLPPGLVMNPFSGLISGTVDYTAAAGSTYAVTVTATDDRIPSASAVPDTFTWTITDTNRPPAMTNPGPQTTPELAPFSIVVTASDPDGTIPSITDSGTLPAWATMTDNLDGTGTISGMPGIGDSGTITVTVTASDGLLTDDAVFDITVTNTNVAPTITNPGNQNGNEGSPFTVVVAASDPDGTTVGFADSGTLPVWATLTDNGDDTATISGTPGYSDAGTTTITITASDGSLTDDAIFDIIIANTNRPPVVDPIGDHSTAETVALTPIAVSATDPDGTVPSLSAPSLPGWATLTDNGDGTGTITGTPGYDDAGITAVTVLALDGSLIGTANFDLTVTNTNRAPVLAGIGGQTVAEGSALPPVTATATDPDGTVPALAASGLPSWAGFVDNGDGTGTITGTPGYTDAGVSTVTIYAEDGGTPNLNDTTSFDITATNTNRTPVLNPIADQTVAEGTALPVVGVVATDPDGTFPALTASGLPGWAAFIDNGDGTATISGTPGYSDAATSTVTITAEDGGVPNLTATAFFDLTVTNTDRPPEIVPIADQTVAEGDPFSLVISATDPDGATPSWNSTSLPGWASLLDNGDGTATIAGTPGHSDAGTTTVTVTASAGSLTTDEVFDVVVTNTNRPPVFVASQPDATSAEGAVISLSAAATDPDLDPIGYAATSLPPGLVIDGGTGLITGTISLVAAAGSPYSVTVTATDQGSPSLSATDSFAWTVTDTNRPPVFDQDLANMANAEGASVSLSVTATDPDLPADTLTYSATGLPPGVVISPATGMISGKISFSGVGVYATVITVTDSGAPNLSATDSFAWTVTNTNQPPVLDPVGSQVGPEETEISFVVSASDPDGDVLTFSLAGGPSGAVIDPLSGVFTWTPAEADGTGSYAVTVIVTDSGSPQLGDSKVVAITVVEANLPPSLVSVANQTTGELSPVNLKITATDPDIPSNVITYSAIGLPPGLSIDPSSGLITGTTTAGSAGTYDVVAKATDDASPALHDSTAFTWTITNSNRNPALQPIAPQSGPEGRTISFTATATDPDGDDLSYSLTGGPTGATIDPETGSFSWTPGESHGPGTFTVYVLATDDGTPALADSQSVTISISESNLAPSIAPVVDQLGEAGDSVRLDITATDPDLPANTLTYNATGLPPGVSIDEATGVMSGTIATDATDTSRYPVVVTVTDDGSPSLSATATFTWTVTAVEETEVNMPPVISPIGDQYTSEGSAVSLTIGATDAGLVSFVAAGLPPGLSIDPSTGIITGTATAHAVGSHTVTVTVTDDETPTMHAKATFGWTVTNVAAAEQKDDLVDALGSFETDIVPSEQSDEEKEQLVRRGLVVMGGAAAATTDALRLPLALLIALLVGFATIGRVGLYPLLWRGERQTGTITMFDPELNFGFIAPDEPGEAVHVHANAFPRRIRPTLTAGMRVRYRVLDSDNRASAWGATPDE